MRSDKYSIMEFYHGTGRNRINRNHIQQVS